MLRCFRVAAVAVLALPILAQGADDAADYVGHELAALDPHWHIPIAADPARIPTHPQFERLTAAHERYAELAGSGGWSSIEPGSIIGLGDVDPRVRSIRDRLRATGDFDAEVQADPYFFDTALREALRVFQRRHRLRQTGTVDERTRQALNVDAEDRRLQLAVALERWRWLPRELEPTHVWVNVPQSRLRLNFDGETVLSMSVIVGHPDRPTPSFRSSVRQLAFNPYWHVPHTIAVEDLLPQQQRDGTFFARAGIRPLTPTGALISPSVAGDIDWNALDAEHFPYRLRQDPGAGNSLGRVKLVMDNPFDVFLHDTPSWRLFYLSARTLSSGCVRLADADALVAEILRRDRGWSNDEIRRLLNDGKTSFVDLDERLPVYIVYMTAWVDDEGLVNFAPDVYGRDQALAARLVSRSYSARWPSTLADR